MKRFQYYHPNSKDIKDEYGDCVIRALTKVYNMKWIEVFDEIVKISRKMQVPFNCKPCYDKYIMDVKKSEYKDISNGKGTKRHIVDIFAKEHREGKYILRIEHHIVAVVDGKYYDTWDCGRKSLYGQWKIT